MQREDNARPEKWQRTLRTVVLLISLIGSIAFPAGQVEGATDRDVLPAVRAFLDQHPEFGDVLGVKNKPDWWRGKKQTLRFKSGTYVFYELDGEIIRVFWIKGSKPLKPSYAAPRYIEEMKGVREAQEGLPSYEVIDAVELIDGGVYGDVLIESMLRATPVEIREQVLREIARKEGFAETSLYCSRDAFRAYMSPSFARAHSNALKTCYLGGLQSGKFTSGEELCSLGLLQCDT